MKKILLLISIFCLPTSSFAQFKKGFGFTTGAWGSGFHFMVDREISEALYSGFEVRFLDVKNDGERSVEYFTPLMTFLTAMDYIVMCSQYGDEFLQSLGITDTEFRTMDEYLKENGGRTGASKRSFPGGMRISNINLFSYY